MRPREFLDLASQLAEGSTPAAYRSAISRAYYAVFNVAEEFLERMGFAAPKRDYHVVLQRRLLASKDADLEKIGSDLGDFHLKRIRADYKMAYKPSEEQDNARTAVNEATRMIDVFENCPIYSARWNQIKEAINIAEISSG